MQSEDYALKTNARAFPSRSKAKAKPQRRTSASSSTKTIPIGERTWTHIEPQDYSLTDYSVSKKKMIFGTNLRILDIGLMKCGRAKWQEAEATRKDFNIVLIHQDKKFIPSELFKVIQGRNPIDPTVQDSVSIPDDFFEYIFIISDVQSVHTPSQIQD